MFRRFYNRLTAALVHRPAAWLSRTLKISPGLARGLMIWGALLYIVIPNDLIPDWLGILGRIDDLLVFAYILYRYRKMVDGIRTAVGGEDPRQDGAHRTGRTAGQTSEHSAGSQENDNRAGPAKPPDPFTVLGVRRGAKKEEIRAAFRQLASQYHPDKVSHLGPELRELAHQKMIEIQKAYEQIG